MRTATLSTPAPPALIPNSPTPSTTPGDTPYEVIHGQFNEKALGIHQSLIATTLATFLYQFAKDHNLGRVVAEGLFRINPELNLQRSPDVAFVSNSRWPLTQPIPNTAAWDVAPDLAIEINSPTNSAEQLLRKIHQYFQAGVARVWVVFPSEQQVYLYSSRDHVQILTIDQSLSDETLLPGFELPLTTLFDLPQTAQATDHGNP